MNRSRALLVAGLLLPLVAPLAHARGLTETRTIRKALPVVPGQQLIVDNLFGEVRVIGDDGDTVRLVATERIQARSQREIERAQKEVQLKFEEVDGVVVLCADGPFRDPYDCTEWNQRSRNNNDRRYKVIYDIELRVPKRIALAVSTVEGDIEVADIQGEFEVHGVNGGIEMEEIVGSGEATTVNGPVRVQFDENPRHDSAFHTVNGEIDISFRPGLSADMSFETMNGDVLTDFEYEALPPRPVRTERHSGRTTYKLNPGGSGIRVASGGPQFTFENINGDILVRKGR